MRRPIGQPVDKPGEWFRTHFFFFNNNSVKYQECESVKLEPDRKPESF